MRHYMLQISTSLTEQVFIKRVLDIVGKQNLLIGTTFSATTTKSIHAVGKYCCNYNHFTRQTGTDKLGCCMIWLCHFWNFFFHFFWNWNCTTRKAVTSLSFFQVPIPYGLKLEASRHFWTTSRLLWPSFVLNYSRMMRLQKPMNKPCHFTQILMFLGWKDVIIWHCWFSYLMAGFSKLLYIYLSTRMATKISSLLRRCGKRTTGWF